MKKLNNETSRRRGTLNGGLIAFAAAAFLYTLTVSGHYTADGLIYAYVIENPTVQTMIDPTHLLLHPLGWIWVQLWQAMGWAGRAILPLQLLNGLAGAACVCLMWSLTYRLDDSARRASFIAAGFAVSGGLWLLSVEAEFVTIPLAMQMLVLWLVMGVATETMRRRAYAVLVGAAVGLAILSYLSSVVLLLVVPVAWLTARLPQKTLLRQVALFSGTALLVTVPTFLAGLGLGAGWGFGVWRAFGGRGNYGVLRWSNLPQGVYAFLRTLGLFPGLVMNDSTRDLLTEAGTGLRILFIAYYIALAALVTTPIVCLARGGRTLWAERREWIFVLAAWSIPFAAFAFFWVPGDVTFWMPLLTAWWLGVGAFCAHRWKRMGWALGVGCVLVLGTINASQVIMPRTDQTSNQAFVVAQEIARATEGDDLILIEGSPFTGLSIAYFAQRSVQLLPAGSEEAQRVIAEAARFKGERGRIYVLGKNGILREIR